MAIQRRRLAALAAISLFAITLPAQAQDAGAVAERFRALMVAQGLDFSWDSISGSGSSFTLDGVKVAPVGGEGPVDIGELSFEGVTEEDGGYKVETVSTEDFSRTDGGITLEMSAAEFTNVSLPAEGATGPLGTLLIYEGADLPKLAVKMGDKTAFSLESLTAEIGMPEEGKPMTFSGAAEKFTADLTLVEDPQSKAVIEALGYQTIKGYLELEGAWQPTDGRLAFTKYDIAVEDAGTLGMTFDIGGYTTQFLAALQDIQKKMAEKPEGADGSAEGLAMLGLMQQLTFHSTTLRWDDESLTTKVVDFLAAQQNISASDIKNQAKAIVPFMVAQLNNPELATQITNAVSAFIDAPSSLQVTAQPTTPVPFAQIAAAGMSNPLELTKTLNVTVTANQDR